MSSARIDSLDIAKLLMSLMIVAIHTELSVSIWSVNLVHPWVRMAVPLFFMISAWLFFEKTWQGGNKGGQQYHLKKFVWRIARLYGFWFIATLPMTLVLRYDQWFCDGWIHGLGAFLTSFAFGSTFPASWFLMALVIDVILVTVMEAVLGRVGMLSLCGCVYAYVCIRSSHFDLVASYRPMATFFGLYDDVLSPIYCSFPAGLLWVAIGSFCAGRTVALKNIKLPWLFCGLAVSVVLLYCEWALSKGSELSCDSYFSLAPCCFMVFVLILRATIKAPVMRKCQNLSIVLYCSHGVVMRLLPTRMLLPYFGDLTPLVKFSWTVAVCIGIFSLFRKLETRPGTEWLSYAH